MFPITTSRMPATMTKTISISAESIC
jgi:hypothetical protein